MRTIHTEITINANAEAVWAALMDFEQYPAWNPFITQIKGEAQVGKQLHVVITPPNQKATTFTPKVVQRTDKQYFSWRGTFIAPWIMTGEHIFEIQVLADNQVKLLHYENFRGMLAGLIINKIGKNTQAGFEAMNQALKNKLEAQVAVN